MRAEALTCMERCMRRPLLDAASASIPPLGTRANPSRTFHLDPSSGQIQRPAEAHTCMERCMRRRILG